MEVVHNVALPSCRRQLGSCSNQVIIITANNTQACRPEPKIKTFHVQSQAGHASVNAKVLSGCLNFNVIFAFGVVLCRLGVTGGVVKCMTMIFVRCDQERCVGFKIGCAE